PIEAVLFAGRADDALGVLMHARAVVQIEGVLLLRLDESATDFDGVKFIAADAAEQDFVVSGLGVEIPLAANSHERYGERPSLAADLHRRPARICRIDD